MGINTRPERRWAHCNKKVIQGDNDPVDVVEIGAKRREIGDVIEARVLGSFCLIDQGEVDWKVILMNREEADERNVGFGGCRSGSCTTWRGTGR